MPKYLNASKHNSSGFTLMELMVAVSIVAILAAIALPSYQSQIRKSRRTEAKSAVLDLAGREEKIFTTTNAYSPTPSDLGYGAVNATFPITIGSGYYQVQVTVPTLPNPPTTFTITATPLGGQAQDTSCASFTVTQAGSPTSVDSSNVDSTATCWK